MMLGLALSICNPTLSGGGGGVTGALNMVFVGDSITYGRGASVEGGSTSFPGVVATARGLTLGTDAFNYGVPSLGSADLIDPDYRLVEDKRNVLVVLIGTNDIYNGGESAAATFARLQAYVSAREARGWYVLICTLPRYDVADPGEIPIAADYSELIRTNYPASKVVDLDADPIVGADADLDPAIFDGNGHFEDAGYAHIGGLIDAKVPASTPAAVIDESVGIVQDSALKLWLRDWYTVSINATDIDNRILNLIGINKDDRYVTASFTYAERVANAINGQRVARFPGDASYTTFGQTWANLIAANAFTIEGVLVLDTVSATSSDAWSNHGLLADSNNNLGVFVKSNGSGGAQVQAYVYDGSAKVTTPATVPLDTPFTLRVTLSGGTLSVYVDGSLVASVGSVGNIAGLTGTPIIGRNTLGSQFFIGDLGQLAIYNNVDGSRATTNNTSNDARFGL